MYTMKLNVTGQQIAVEQMPELVAGSAGVYEAEFHFDESWAGYTRTAVFAAGGVERECLLNLDKCTVPWEMMEAGGVLQVGVYGLAGENRMPTVWTEPRFLIRRGAGPAQEGQAPSPDMAQQILAAIGPLTELETAARGSLVEAINELYYGGGFGGAGADGVGITDAQIGENGHLMLTLSDESTLDAGYVLGEAGPQGIQGNIGNPGQPGYSPVKGVDYWTSQDKAEIMGQSLMPTFVGSTEEMTDTDQAYVLTTDGFIYAYGSKTTVSMQEELFQNSGYELNMRIGSSGATAKDGNVLSGMIAVDLTEATPYILRVKGMTLDQMAPGSNNRIGYYDGSGALVANAYHFYPVPTASGQHIIETELDGEDYLIKLDSVPSNSTVGTLDEEAITHVRVCISIDETRSITEEDVAMIQIYREVDQSTQVTTGWNNTGLAYTPADYSGTVAQIQSDMNVIGEKIAELEGNQNAGNGAVPDYWQEAIENLKQTMKLRQANGPDCFQFVWCSDIHGTSGYVNGSAGTSSQTHLGAVAQRLCQEFDIPLVVVTGDIMSQNSHTALTAVEEEYEGIGEILGAIDQEKLVCTAGNHDGAWGAAEDGVYYLKNMGTRALYNHIFRAQAMDGRREFGPEGNYFYLDYRARKIRLVMLNFHTDGDGSQDSSGHAVYNSMKQFVLGSKQIQWLEEEALEVPQGWEIVLMGHPQVALAADGTLVKNIIRSYNSRAQYTGESVSVTSAYWGNGLDSQYNTSSSVDRDFTDAKGRIIAYFHGHIHKDSVDKTVLDCPSISITTAGGDVRDDDPVERIVGTATEAALDIVTIDRAAGKIYMTRVGAGSSRETTY